ncbi:D-glycero-beta-D-manno-heptose 1-phosphate adenylyltransferase [Chryseosolibacter indicus]|uniref:Bifunctional protein HldE n=1 Tax=Chryseosolibacter indicus TaxID=2782351 RepID=A0ABS5VQU9_9BACT|nr:D-glycero-beta-D-manno-heptose 1-phosphate adenylyltransferase [Chryseosolibacter indicus]MBT1703817.1 D-glycero-beta-D-manno-heptose 1-phosphate adenylyltransferase [Chryseosolibacter indicus]
MNTLKLSHQEIINGFQNKNVLVIGDMILDVYLKGTSTRLSPEAPVPVVDVKERKAFLGGAANTVCNLKALGANVTFCTVVGEDAEGDEAIELLEKIDVKNYSILRTTERKTIAKTRVMSGKHVITRFDYGSCDALDEETADILIEYITENYESCDAIFLSDYDKGIITDRVLQALKALQSKMPKFLAVDSKRLTFFSSLHPYLVKPNYDEVVKLMNLPYQVSGRAEQIRDVSAQLYEKVNAELIAVTLDSEGSMVIELGQAAYRCFAPPIATPYVAGAGDTYLSAFVLAYITSIDSRRSADIANAAAHIAVKKELTSTCSNAELKNYYSVQSKYVGSFAELENICENYRAQGKRIVFTNGCFDILHSGHVTYLHCAKELGDVLIVGVNTDESIKRLKGESRPINPLLDRLQVLAGLASIDYVVAFGNEKDDTPIEVIKVVKPNIFAKGGDYTKEKLPEASTVEQFGGQIVFLPHIPDHSTTEIIRRISNTATSDQAVIITSLQ